MNFLLLLLSLQPPPDHLPYPPTLFSVTGAARVVSMVKGLVLSRHIRPGMRDRDVHALLGPYSSFSGSCFRLQESYYSLGIAVEYRHQNDLLSVLFRGPGVWVVEEVRYIWAAWCWWREWL